MEHWVITEAMGTQLPSLPPPQQHKLDRPRSADATSSAETMLRSIEKDYQSLPPSFKFHGQDWLAYAAQPSPDATEPTLAIAPAHTLSH